MCLVPNSPVRSRYLCMLHNCTFTQMFEAQVLYLSLWRNSQGTALNISSDCVKCNVTSCPIIVSRLGT